MSGLKRTAQKFINSVMGRGLNTNRDVRGMKSRREAAKVTAGKDKMFQSAALPDEEDIRRIERRKASQRRSARAKTILTDRDTLG